MILKVHKKFYKFSENLICASEFIEKERNKAVSKVLINGKVVISKFLQIDDFLQREILYFLMEIYYQDDLILLKPIFLNIVFTHNPFGIYSVYNYTKLQSVSLLKLIILV